MKKAVLREYLKNRETKPVVDKLETTKEEKPKKKAKKGDK